METVPCRTQAVRSCSHKPSLGTPRLRRAKRCSRFVSLGLFGQNTGRQRILLRPKTTLHGFSRFVKDDNDRQGYDRTPSGSACWIFSRDFRAPSLLSSRRIRGKRLNAADYKLAVTSRYQNERFRRGSGGSISACARRISAVSGRSART
jgi:hypothetical protein